MKAHRSVLLMVAVLLVVGCGATASKSAVSLRPPSEGPTEATEEDIAALFERWNRSLRSGDPWEVVANYAERSILLPTLSNELRLTREEKAEYFRYFLENGPSGRIDLRRIEIASDLAVDSGLYTIHFAKTGVEVRARYSFAYRRYGDRWLIVSHHSSVLPEK